MSDAAAIRSRSRKLRSRPTSPARSRQGRYLDIFRRHFHEISRDPAGWELLGRVATITSSSDQHPSRERGVSHVRGLRHVRQAAEILLTEGVPPAAAAAMRAQLATLFAQMDRLDRVHPEWGLGRVPHLRGDPLRSFLWRACVRNPPAAVALIGRLRTALLRALREWPRRRDVKRPTLDRLPYKAVVLVRHFAASRMVGPRLIGPLRLADIRQAVETYRAGPHGLQTLKTQEEYISDLARALGVSPPGTAVSPRVSAAAWPALSTLAPHFSQEDAEVAAAIVGEDAGVRRGILAHPVEEPSDGAHPLEEALWIRPESFPSAWSRCVPRAEWFEDVWDGRGLTPNEDARLLRLFSQPALAPETARFYFFVAMIVFTGMLPKRVLAAYYWPGEAAALEEWLARQGAGLLEPPGDLVVFAPVARALWAKVPRLAPPRDADGSPPLGTVRLPLPPVIWRLAEIGWPRGVRGEPPGWPAFRTPRGDALDIGMLRRVLGELARSIAPLDPTPTRLLTRLRRTLRCYAADAGCSSLVPALMTGASTLHEQVLLHYVRYPTARLWQESARAQGHLVTTARRILAPTGFVTETEPPGPAPDWLPSGHYGAHYGVDAPALRRAWEVTHAALRTARHPARRLNLDTLLTATITITGAGLRELELPGLLSEQHDPAAALLRVRGKSSGYYREGRETPLCCLVNGTICRYTARLVPAPRPSLFWVDLGSSARPLQAGDLDRVIGHEGLHWAWAFRPAHLRHLLRTTLELLDVPEVVIDDSFGHASEVTTALHQLGSTSVIDLQEDFRRGTMAVLRPLLEGLPW